jgi:hypothetical protein
VVRAEAAWYFNKKFAADDLSLNGINEKDYVHYLIGYDHSWYGINISLQFIQEYIRDYEDNIRNDEFSNTMTCLLSEDFWRETMRLEMFAYYGMNDNDALLRPKIVYDLADGVQVQIGANIFVGDDGNFGQYNKNDLIYLKARYDF